MFLDVVWKLLLSEYQVESEFFLFEVLALSYQSSPEIIVTAYFYYF